MERRESREQEVRLVVADPVARAFLVRRDDHRLPARQPDSREPVAATALAELDELGIGEHFIMFVPFKSEYQESDEVELRFVYTTPVETVKEFVEKLSKDYAFIPLADLKINRGLRVLLETCLRNYVS